MTILNNTKVAKIDNSLYKDIAMLQKEIERKTCCALSFRKASKLYAQANNKNVVTVNIDGLTVKIQRK